jgi:hypothetical protein
MALAMVPGFPFEYKQYSRTEGFLHLAVHAVAYGSLAFLSAVLFRGPGLFAAICLLVFLGACLEWLQAIRYIIRLEMGDVIANIAGVLSGVLLSKIMKAPAKS